MSAVSASATAFSTTYQSGTALLSIEESKLDELFTFQFKYSFDTLSNILRQLIEKMNSQQVQLLYLKDLSEKLHRQSSLDKHYDQRIVFLEQLTTQ